MYPRQVVLQFNSSKANMLQFVNLLFQTIVKLLHHHQGFIRPDAPLGSHPGLQKHVIYWKCIHSGLWCGTYKSALASAKNIVALIKSHITEAVFKVKPVIVFTEWITWAWESAEGFRDFRHFFATTRWRHSSHATYTKNFCKGPFSCCSGTNLQQYFVSGKCSQNLNTTRDNVQH